jgi:DNA-binding NtrC family response regulator
MGPRIEALSGRWRGTTFPITETELIIGRDPSNDICLDDDLASRRHCTVRLEDRRALLVDLESSNGTFVNGFCFPSKILVHGDRIKMGSSRFVYLDRDEVDDHLAKLLEQHQHEPTARTARAEAFDAAETVILGAFLEMNASINTIRNPDDIQSRILDLIFQVIPAERAAILMAGHDQNRFVSAAYRRIGSLSSEPFPVDEAMTRKVLLDGDPIDNLERGILCRPMTAFDAKVGVLYLVFATSGYSCFNPAHLSMLRSIAGFAAVALEHARYVEWLEGENQRLKEVIHTEHGMIGRSEKMREVYDFINRAGPTDRTVLILGASGTGKELTAHAIHRNSPRSGKPFIAVNCGAFTETLLESELFGHEKGSFTGALSQRKGLFELADGGTMFLDEIGELPISMQSALLRVLQDGEFKRLGGSRWIRVNVRIVAATNRNLDQAIREKRFREDLFFRVNVLEVEMPALCDRREDIPPLAAHFIKKYGYIRTNSGMPEVLGITAEAHHLLAVYAWPGNIRELEHAIERAISLGVSEYILPEDLPRSLRTKHFDGGEIGTYDAELDAFRKALFERMIRKSAGNYPLAAQMLGLNVKYFYQLCRDLNVEWQ